MRDEKMLFLTVGAHLINYVGISVSGTRANLHIPVFFETCEHFILQRIHMDT